MYGLSLLSSIISISSIGWSIISLSVSESESLSESLLVSLLVSLSKSISSALENVSWFNLYSFSIILLAKLNSKGVSR